MGRQAGRGRRKVQLASARNPRRAHWSRRWYLRYLKQTPHGLDRVRGRQGDVRWSPRAHRIGESYLNASKPTPIQSCTEDDGNRIHRWTIGLLFVFFFRFYPVWLTLSFSFCRRRGQRCLQWKVVSILPTSSFQLWSLPIGFYV